jgi:hypothetical protein
MGVDGMSKRTHIVKVCLNDEEMLDIQAQALAQDMPPAEVVRRNCVTFMWGILGQAQRRRNKTRGAEESLKRTDFQDTQTDWRALEADTR